MCRWCAWCSCGTSGVKIQTLAAMRSLCKDFLTLGTEASALRPTSKIPSKPDNRTAISASSTPTPSTEFIPGLPARHPAVDRFDPQTALIPTSIPVTYPWGGLQILVPRWKFAAEIADKVHPGRSKSHEARVLLRRCHWPLAMPMQELYQLCEIGGGSCSRGILPPRIRANWRRK